MLEFTTAGYIEVRLAGGLVSRHRMEREAIESILRHCDGKPSADYELVYPKVIVTYTAPELPAAPTESESGTIDGGGQFYDLGELIPVKDLPATWAKIA